MVYLYNIFRFKIWHLLHKNSRIRGIKTNKNANIRILHPMLAFENGVTMLFRAPPYREFEDIVHRDNRLSSLATDYEISLFHYLIHLLIDLLQILNGYCVGILPVSPIVPDRNLHDFSPGDFFLPRLGIIQSTNPVLRDISSISSVSP